MNDSLTTVKQKPRDTKTAPGHLLRIGDAETLLCFLVNFRFPSEAKRRATTAELWRLKTMTEDHWPDLWEWIDETPKSERGALRVETWDFAQAEKFLLKIRWYLRKFWKSKDKFERRWHIDSLIRFHYRNLLLRRKRLSPAALERELDNPPENSPFADALARITESHMRFCENSECNSGESYFIDPSGKGRYCSEECAQIAHRKDNREWAANRRAAAKGKRNVSL